MNGVVVAARLAAQGHLASGLLERERAPARRACSMFFFRQQYRLPPEGLLELLLLQVGLQHPDNITGCSAGHDQPQTFQMLKRYPFESLPEQLNEAFCFKKPVVHTKAVGWLWNGAEGLRIFGR